jgi:hypothetical protein
MALNIGALLKVVEQGPDLSGPLSAHMEKLSFGGKGSSAAQ